MTKNYITLLLLLLTTSGLFAQINFEKGYFISNNGQKVDCYIKNLDWINNPVDFEYKLTLDSEVKIARLVTVKSFTIPNICKYEKHTVNVDISTKDYAKLNYDKNPEWKEQIIFLNVLVEGKASLYRYKNGDLSKLFFKKDGSQIKQLVKKDYLTKDGKLAENNEFRQQLYTQLTCESISRKRVSRLRYNKNDLTQFFTDYNTCTNNDFITYKQETKGKFSFGVNIGILNQKTVLNTQSIFGFTSDGDESNQKWGPRFGIDLEYTLPFNKNKWALFIAPYYQSYKGSENITSQTSSIVRSYEVEYSAIQVPLGVRHFMFLNDTSKLFLNVGVIIDFPLTTNFEGVLAIKNDSFKTSAGGILGLGYTYDKYSLEIRYTTPRELIENTAQTSIKLHQFGLVLGYTIY